MTEERKMTADEAAKYYRAKLLELKFKKEQQKTAGAQSEQSNEHAPSFFKLAKALGVSRTTLYGLKDNDDAPKQRADGTYDIQQWKMYIDTVMGEGDELDDDEYNRHRIEYLKVRTEKEKYALLERKGQLLTISEHLSEVREILEQAKWLTRTIPTRVALLTTDSTVKDSVQKLCDHIAAEFSERLISATEKEADARQSELVISMETQKSGKPE